MKALILVAGRGTRISQFIDGMPKCLLPTFDGTPMIVRNVSMMLDAGIQPILCTGYQDNMIKDALKEFDLIYYENPFYAVTNNIASVWFSRNEFDGDDDVLLVSGDLYYPKSFMAKALEATGSLSMFVDSSRILDGDWYVHRDDDGFFESYGSDLPVHLREFENMGISRVGKEIAKDFSTLVDEIVRCGRYDTYFENALIEMSERIHQPIEVIDVAGEFWREYDYYEDYEKILEFERGL